MKPQGIRVVDLSLFLPGPLLTLAMADHGAEVIKVEPPGGDPGRAIGPSDGPDTVFFRNQLVTLAPVQIGSRPREGTDDAQMDRGGGGDRNVRAGSPRPRPHVDGECHGGSM